MANAADAIQRAASLSVCIDTARAAGELDRARATALKNTLADLEARYAQIMPPAAASAQAARDIRDAVARGLPARYHSTLAQLQAMQRLRAQIEGSDRPDQMLKNLLSNAEGQGNKGESLQSLIRAYQRSINAAIHEVLEATGEPLNPFKGSRDSQLLNRILDELHGDDSGDAVARRMADQVRAQQERLRVAFNAHGGDIGRLDDFGISHSHDVVKMRAQGFDAWRDTIATKLDWSRIQDFATGKPFARKKGEIPDRAVTDRFLRDVYDNVTTRGWNTREATMGAQGRALYNKRADHRVLHFQSGAAWREYNKAFGDGDLFSSLIGGLHGMARDVALMRVLGPNPRLGLQFAEALAQRQASRLADGKLEQRVASAAAHARGMLAHLNGSANSPVNTAWASFFSGVRGFKVSTSLGSAILSAPSDLATLTAASRIVGMNGANVLSRHVELMASNATRRTAARMGYVADTLADAGAATSRYTGDIWVPNLARRFAGFTMRATGLSHWTDMARTAFQMEFAGFMADHADSAWDALPDVLRRTMSNRGINASDWDMLRATEGRFVAENGADFISPFYWLENQTALPRDQAEGLAMRLQMMVEEHMEYAVPTGNVEATAWVLGETKPGTFSGELLRSGVMFKSFAMSLTLNQVRRIQALPTPMNKAKYAGGLALGLLLLGAVSVQLKEMAKGRDPRPMTPGSFWMAALFQGGGLGIFGDFFSAETNRMGGGIPATLAGPIAGLAGDVTGLFMRPLDAIIADENHNIGRGVSDFVRRNTPFFSSAWYARAAYDRLVADNLQRFLDPEAEANWRRQERRRESDFGNATWWERGDMLPFRWPDATNAMGAAQ